MNILYLTIGANLKNHLLSEKQLDTKKYTDGMISLI